MHRCGKVAHAGERRIASRLAADVPQPPNPTGIDWLKELVIAVIALAIMTALLVTYGKLGQMPATLDDAIREQMSNLKSIGTALFAIFGAIIGYYCGRVPAERSATAAQQVANSERIIAEREKDTARRATALLAQARDRVEARAVLDKGEAADPFLRDVDSFLRQRGWS